MNPAVYYELDNHAFSLGFSTYDLPTPKPITEGKNSMWKPKYCKQLGHFYY